ncbi:KEX1 [Candida oxycetoniae]|uniref:Pheromone-processing carboxypeptidase KEX1 n=1 Tax=Candida oxycetoniae TaxID=497107 RepID=A0AAI9WXY2_9ASCO|nr:KEX1 [Candida oxycetoniae]KAI3404787.2 KEX1 [Candida oxycetoniae]
MLACSLYSLVLLAACCVFAIPPKEGSDNDAEKQYMVTNLPGLHENIDDDFKPIMFSGQLELFPENNTNYFFWKFSDPNMPKDSIYSNRTIFWLNGGPGCSSMDGALLETGPFRIDKSQKVIMNNGSWHKVGDIIYVDQPVGTGFSYGEQDKLLHDLDEMAFYFLKFMQEYYKLYPQDVGNDIYFAGESYAGQYIPYIADAIIKRNARLSTEETRYNLKGLLIGNGWVSPNEQSLAYLPFFINKNLINKDNPQWMQLLKSHENCQKIVDKIDSHFNDDTLNPLEVDSSQCESILTDLLRVTMDRNAAHTKESCINMYDYTLRDSYPSCGMNWPSELPDVTSFLRNEDVKHDLNLKKMKTWHECSSRVGTNFNARKSRPSVHLLPDLLEHIPIILFNGANDIICNEEGVLRYINKLEWNGHKGFENSDAQIDWIHEDKNVGYILHERNLTFINIYNSSHMVPYDLPDVSRALMDIITGNYDRRQDEGGKPSFITYPIGVKIKGVTEETTPQLNSTNSSSSNSSSKAEKEEEEEPSINKFIRLVQLAVILIVIWGVYILYASYKARPSPVSKKASRSGTRKKNVQWADQVSSIQGEENFSSPSSSSSSPPPPPLPPAPPSSKKGFIAKTLDKLRSKDSRGTYSRAQGEDYIDDIELGDSIPEGTLDDFIIDSDDEREEHQSGSDNVHGKHKETGST